VGQIHPAEGNDTWRVLVNMVLNRRVHCGIRVAVKDVAEGLNLNGMWHYVVGRVVAGIWTVHMVFIFRIK
jgi:hypothetical protein